MPLTASAETALTWGQQPDTPETARPEGWLLQSVFGDTSADEPWTDPPAGDSGVLQSVGVQGFHPAQPSRLKETGISVHLISALVLKYLLHVGKSSGRDIAKQIRLPFRVLDELLKALKDEQIISYTRAAGVGDFEYLLTEQGRVQAKQLKEQSTYFGSAPVPFRDYVESVKRQALSRSTVTPAQVTAAFSDLTLTPQMVRRVGQALASSATMLLFGNPGNGKTSIAERMIKPFHDAVWVPRAIEVDGDIIRLFDPAIHDVCIAGESNVPADDRWVRIRRPIVIVGGELTLETLELAFNASSHTFEAPVQLKSNCGVLLIDDFGRQKIDPEHILNRWIVPLEKRIDYLDLRNGKRVCVPFEQMLVFSTNLRPADVVDEAFLRRITYKVEVPDPTEEQFRVVFRQVAEAMQISVTEPDLDDLLQRHYRAAGRALRYCHARDLLKQVAAASDYLGLPRQYNRTLVDEAVQNYFCVSK